ncbi:hypothetical protein J3R75_000082 [Oligosphaera ethanolica]|uniref:Uncharacterized protein n=1 Tax=Oligosphaera ethanolica TaxID=760260 RepID=A0AAE3VCJ6_9BACT|nr:hypothetical protein [Oligosphaera ethanolica]
MTAQIWIIIGAVVAWETIELRLPKPGQAPA